MPAPNFALSINKKSPNKQIPIPKSPYSHLNYFCGILLLESQRRLESRLKEIRESISLLNACCRSLSRWLHELNYHKNEFPPHTFTQKLHCLKMYKRKLHKIHSDYDSGLKHLDFCIKISKMAQKEEEGLLSWRERLILWVLRLFQRPAKSLGTKSPSPECYTVPSESNEMRQFVALMKSCIKVEQEYLKERRKVELMRVGTHRIDESSLLARMTRLQMIQAQKGHRKHQMSQLRRSYISHLLEESLSNTSPMTTSACQRYALFKEAHIEWLSCLFLRQCRRSNLIEGVGGTQG
uniref:Uncharacterized protein n=1 Tax=Percolomonas cosmopolitus TaxID=63605 RepID=A0A7S1PHN4_9EUKA